MTAHRGATAKKEGQSCKNKKNTHTYIYICADNQCFRPCGGGEEEDGRTRHPKIRNKRSPVSLRQRRTALRPPSVSKQPSPEPRRSRGGAGHWPCHCGSAKSRPPPPPVPPPAEAAGRSLVFSLLYTARGCHAAAENRQSAASMTRGGHAHDRAPNKRSLCRGAATVRGPVFQPLMNWSPGPVSMLLFGFVPNNSRKVTSVGEAHVFVVRCFNLFVPTHCFFFIFYF